MKKYLAEFLATFFLVFAAAGAVVGDQHLAVVEVRDSFGPLGVALAYGFAFAAAIIAVARISGGYANPAVSLALFVTGRLNAKDLLGYIVGQLLGSLAAAFLIARLFLAQAVDQAGVGAPALQESLTTFQGIAIEIVLTFLLVLVIWGVAVERKGQQGEQGFGAVIIGLTLAAVALVGVAFTGAAVNPARWFGPAVAAGQMDNWPVWIVGPAVGALLAALLYESVFSADDLQGSEMADTGVGATDTDQTDSMKPPASGTDNAGSRRPTASVPAEASRKPSEPSAGQPGLSASMGETPVQAPPPPPPPPPAPTGGSQPGESLGGSSAQKTPEQTPAPGPASSENEES